jgi:EmrB/QacA subfamily drug resistance transporter
MGNRAAPMTPHQRWALALASAASFMIALDSTVVSTALGTIRRDLGASVASLEWTVNAYVLSFAVLLMTGAALGDRFGRRRMLVAGLGLFSLSSAACALAPGIGALIAARAAEGAGAALIMPLALTQVTAAFPAGQRGRALGIFAGGVGLATLSGPLAGGAIAQGWAWPWIFWINVPIGLAVGLLVLARIPASRGPDGGLDIGGVLLAMGGASGLVWGAIQASGKGWASTEVISSLVAGSLLVAAFVAWERHVSTPMLPLRFFRSRAFALANTANFALIGSMYGVLFFLAQYLQAALGYGPLGAGLRMMPWTGTLLVTAPLVGRLADRFGERGFLAGGLLMQAAGTGWLAVLARPGLPYPQLLLPLVVSGCGIAMAMPAVQKAAMGAVGPADIGRASGAFSMLRQLGGVFGIAIVVSVFAGHGSYVSAAAFTRGFAPAMGTAALLALAGAAAAACLPRRGALPASPPGSRSAARAGRWSLQLATSARADETPAPVRPAAAGPAGDGVNWGHGHRPPARGVQPAPDG